MNNKIQEIFVGSGNYFYTQSGWVKENDPEIYDRSVRAMKEGIGTTFEDGNEYTDSDIEKFQSGKTKVAYLFTFSVCDTMRKMCIITEKEQKPLITLFSNYENFENMPIETYLGKIEEERNNTDWCDWYCTVSEMTQKYQILEFPEVDTYRGIILVNPPWAKFTCPLDKEIKILVAKSYINLAKYLDPSLKKGYFDIDYGINNLPYLEQDECTVGIHRVFAPFSFVSPHDPSLVLPEVKEYWELLEIENGKKEKEREIILLPEKGEILLQALLNIYHTIYEEE